MDEEGNKILIPYNSEAETLEEAIASIGLPKGTNQLFKVQFTQGSKKVFVALAPHVGQQIFEQLDIKLFKNKFGIK